MDMLAGLRDDLRSSVSLFKMSLRLANIASVKRLISRAKMISKFLVTIPMMMRWRLSSKLIMDFSNS